VSWTEHPKVTPWRERSPAVDFVVDTIDAYTRHRTGRNASLLAYKGLLTVFPLLLAATTVLGLVLEGNDELQQQIIDSALSQIPVVGDALRDNQGAISGNWWAFAIGLAGAVWGSLRAFVALQTSLDDIWEVESDRDNFVFQRLRALIGIGVIFLGQAGSVVLASLVSHAGLPRSGQFLLTLGGLALNVVIVASMYRFLTSRDTTWRLVVAGRRVHRCPVHRPAAPRHQHHDPAGRQRRRGLRRVRRPHRARGVDLAARARRARRGRAQRHASSAAARRAARRSTRRRRWTWVPSGHPGLA
jgi:membrane protein